MIKLIGIIVVAVGFALRANTLLVVMAAGVATGLAAGMSFNEIIAHFGRFFVANRYMTLTVVLIVPVIGVLERHGLQERAAMLIKRMRAATAGRVLLLYAALRQISISLGVNVGGHPQTVRPLVAPMAEGAARARHGELREETVHAIRAHAAAAENVGNFFGEDIFVAVGAVLLMKGFFDAQKIAVSVWHLALWGIPTAIVAFAAMAWRARALDRRIARESAGAKPREEAT
ncbi:MAG TPA: DUF969 domain-containing protein [Opitutus sp.]|nr:DUF969 domain-containing protein [Opitutus sp.]